MFQLKTKGSHVEDLLEAKSLALEQADRLIAEYRCKRVKADAEVCHVFIIACRHVLPKLFVVCICMKHLPVNRTSSLR